MSRKKDKTTVENKKARNNRLKKDPIKFLRELFSGTYTPPIVNILMIIISVVLILGVVYTFFVSNYLTLISEPVLPESENTSKQNRSQIYQSYESERYGFKIDFPENWNLIVSNSENHTENIFRIFPWSVGYKENLVSGYYLNLHIYPEDAVPIALADNNNKQENRMEHYQYNGGYMFYFEYIGLSIEKMSTSEKEAALKTYEEILDSFEYLKDDKSSLCIVTGCSSQICSDQPMNTTCEYRSSYACFKSATCEVQATGECGWTITPTLQQCLEDSNGF
ncbi:hypothetical protein ACFL0C_00970 [Patescibacteria group bacterium]